MQLTPEELVAEFHDAVMELYFARKRIVVLEAEVAALRAQLATATGTAPTTAAEPGQERARAATPPPDGSPVTGG